ncbi:hypothetical protein [Deinococcus aquatilis]|uniref:hypothetical protein n=1 Tax=Deinococcus aquatilis TaxID=519440 RepID=UPI00047611DC|nr:hypothetical protein [Deinococcus aquatilis]
MKEQVEERFYDDEVRDQTEHLEPHTDNFVIVQVASWTDALDYDQTIIVQTDSSSGKPVAQGAGDLESTSLNPEEIEHLQLNVSEDDLPGVFRIRGLGNLLCAEKTKLACERARIVGMRFTPIPTPLSHGARAVEGGFRLLSAADLLTAIS